MVGGLYERRKVAFVRARITDDVSTPEFLAFLDAADAWKRRRDERDALRMLRSPYSGVPHEIAGAYATLAERGEPLHDLLAHERIAVSGSEREALIAFRQMLTGGDVEAVQTQQPSPPVQRHSDGEPFQLASVVEREPGTALRNRHPHFSASSLNAYVECMRKWYYRYMCAAVEDRASSASTYGTAFHAALEALHTEHTQPHLVAPDLLGRKLQGHLNVAFDKFRSQFDTAVEFELQLRRAQRTGKRYVEWLLAQAQRSPFTVVGCELPAQLELEGYNFIGYIDRLDRDETTGNVVVIDYKTGAIATSAAEYREKVRQFKDFQLPFYYWARTAEGDRVSTLALLPLKEALLDVRPVSLEVVPVAAPPPNRRSDMPSGVISVAELERAKTRMIELCRELADTGVERFPVTTDPSACTYCTYFLACNERPIPAEDKFGR
ncbi:MAG: PD-(D/E)XK nuclease family protein [Candidatus Eremiobacteraeota bacterium]|nr:PD-(D/E)XK nuclease family protein [Candidatus Eremiobacteraeota bacterium]